MKCGISDCTDNCKVSRKCQFLKIEVNNSILSHSCAIVEDCSKSLLPIYLFKVLRITLAYAKGGKLLGFY